jgi:hypothetical protein
MKKQLTAIPAHYRQLSPDEVICKGDLKLRNGQVRRASNSIGRQAGTCSSTVWRRRHVEVGYNNTLWGYVAPKKSTVPVKKEHPVEKNPLVHFNYPSSNICWHSPERIVRLIAVNRKYIVGIEVSDKNKFKKFLRSKATGFKIVEFNPTAI